MSQSQFHFDGGNFRNISLRLHGDNNVQWWELNENCNDTIYERVLSKLPYADCKLNSVFYSFNDKLFPSSLSPFIGGGYGK